MTAQQRAAGTADGERRSSTDESGGNAGGNNLGRAAMAVVGGALAIAGLRRRSAVGAVMTLVGGWLAYRGLRGTAPSIPTETLSAAVPSGGTGSTQAGGPTEVERTITVDAPAEELHEHWKDPADLSRILGEFVEISDAGEGRLRWRVDPPIEQLPLDRLLFDRLPVDRSVVPESYSWETEFVRDEPGEVLRWETVEGTRLPSEWTLTFADAPGDRGTEATLRAEFHPPGGSLGARAMDRLGFALDPLVGASLRRSKSLAETGEIPTLAGNPSARGQGDLA